MECRIILDELFVFSGDRYERSLTLVPMASQLQHMADMILTCKNGRIYALKNRYARPGIMELDEYAKMDLPIDWLPAPVIAQLRMIRGY